MYILRTQDLNIGYRFLRHPAKIIGQNLNLYLKPGELVCVIGPNGAGKSTLLRTLAGIQSPLGGYVMIGGQLISTMSAQELARKVSVVLTAQVNVGMMTGYALVALGRHPHTAWSGRLTRHDEAVVRWAVAAVGAETLAERFINELSDGERQKIMIARALAQEPALMILDEPTAFLDLPRRVEIMHLLRRLAHTTKRAFLLSTHDLELALRHADRIWLMDSEGNLHTGAPEDLVLNGTFQRSFEREGILFDPQDGAFRIAQSSGHKVYVIGEGVRQKWTIRALERQGFTIASKINGSPPSLSTPIVAVDETAWYIQDEQAAILEKFHDVYTLLQWLANRPQLSGNT
jgi:iron complex transport system ATP-binding protein